MNAKEKILEFCKKQNAIVEIIEFENNSNEQLPDNQQFDYFCKRIAEEALHYGGIKIDVHIFEDEEDSVYYECINNYTKRVFLRYIHFSEKYNKRMEEVRKKIQKMHEEYYKSIGLL